MEGVFPLSMCFLFGAQHSFSRFLKLLLLLLLFLTRAAVMKRILTAPPRPQPRQNQLRLTQEQIETIWYWGALDILFSLQGSWQEG